MNPHALGAVGVLIIIASLGGLVALAAGPVVAGLIVALLVGVLIVWVAWVTHTEPTGKGGAS